MSVPTLHVVRAEERREVVNELIVGLISLNRKVAGVADDRLLVIGVGLKKRMIGVSFPAVMLTSVVRKPSP